MSVFVRSYQPVVIGTDGIPERRQESPVWDAMEEETIQCKQFNCEWHGCRTPWLTSVKVQL